MSKPERQTEQQKPEEIAGVIRFDTGEEIQVGEIRLKVTIADAPNLKLKLMGKKRFNKSMNGRMILLKKLPFIVKEVTKKYICCSFCNQTVENDENKDKV